MTQGAFYKKNNKWTEGLISAAQAVANATVELVTIADGLVAGTKDLEELVVAAQEVSVATTQLVAASRVKAARGKRLKITFFKGKTQDRLETAASAVREATKLLVKAAKVSFVNNLSLLHSLHLKVMRGKVLLPWVNMRPKLKKWSSRLESLNLRRNLIQRDIRWGRCVNRHTRKNSKEYILRMKLFWNMTCFIFNPLLNSHNFDFGLILQSF